MGIKVDENGVHINLKEDNVIDADKMEEKKKKRLQDRIASVIDSASFGLSLLAYIVLGLCMQKVTFISGYSSWVVFIPLIIVGTIPGNTYRAIVRKDFSLFPIWGVALLTYLLLGTIFGMWHPYWLILLIIPVYYSIFTPISKLLKDKREGRL